MDHNLWIGFEPKPTWLKDNQIRILVRKGCQDSSDLIDRTLRSWTVRIQLWVHTRWTIGYLIWSKIVGTGPVQLATYSQIIPWQSSLSASVHSNTSKFSGHFIFLKLTDIKVVVICVFEARSWNIQNVVLRLSRLNDMYYRSCFY